LPAARSIFVRAPAIFAAGLCAAVLAVTPAGAAIGGRNGKIAYDRSGPYFPLSGEIHTINPDGTGDAVVVPYAGTPNLFPAWSPDGTKIAFSNGNRLRTVNADGSNAQTVLTWTGRVGGVDWSPDGQQFAVALDTCDPDGECRFDVYTLQADGTGLTDITPDPADDRDPSWSAGTLRIAFSSSRSGNADIWSVVPDGSSPVQLTTSSSADLDPDWSPDGEQLVWTNGQSIFRMKADGTNVTGVTGGDAPAWAPEQFSVTFARSDPQCVGREAIWTARYDGALATRISDPFYNDQCVNDPTDGHPDWQPLPGSYVRPKGATPLRVPLVPAYQACTAPNTSHGSPLAFGACAPPAQSSPNLTVGTSEANGQPNRSSGFVLLKFTPSIFDASVSVALTDVRDQATLGAYSGELQLRFTTRVTDKDNSATASEPETTIDFDAAGSFPCAPSSSSAGSDCRLTTRLGALVGALGPLTGRRQVWQIDRIRVNDGGPDGDGDTEGDNSLFATQGVFVP
jgi:dipeptidyl aminopeptidase/acylaminoacyl peptidase